MTTQGEVSSRVRARGLRRAGGGVLLALALVVAVLGGSTAEAATSPDAVQLLVSDSPDRSNPRLFTGSLLKGDEYVFISPSDGVKSVSFGDASADFNGYGFVDSTAPFDYFGTKSSDGRALPWDTRHERGSTGHDGVRVLWAYVQFWSGDTRQLRGEADVVNTFPGRVVVTPRMVDFATGENSVTATWPAVPGAVAYYTSGGYTTGTTWTGPTSVDPSYPIQYDSYFEVQALRGPTLNDGPLGQPARVPLATFPPCLKCKRGYDPQLVYSLSADHSNPKPLKGATVRGRIYVFLATTGLWRPPGVVTFTVDADYQGYVNWALEIDAPFDFTTTGANKLGRGIDVSKSFTPGRHGIIATACWLIPDDTYCTAVPALFTVAS